MVLTYGWLHTPSNREGTTTRKIEELKCEYSHYPQTRGMRNDSFCLWLIQQWNQTGEWRYWIISKT
jgi:hypothetical protein